VMNMTEEQLSALSDGDAREEIEKSRKIAQLADFEEYEDSWGDADAKANFSGPVVLLTSRKTISAAEDFTAFFRTNRRGTLIGAPTCG
ncbi:S41 family peptidase, partial [Klebsiella pneumoniae]|uniref:S41 family peptidase n=1 Tax=Klebsiella pneumoniae TaxID=573 RepID=UPI0025A30760